MKFTLKYTVTLSSQHGQILLCTPIFVYDHSLHQVNVCFVDEKWPFFDSVLPQDALWDVPPPSSDAWPSVGTTGSNTGIWQPSLAPGSSTAVTSSPGAWSNIGSIWSSPATLSPDTSLGLGTSDVIAASHTSTNNYDPFNNLWNPSSFTAPTHSWPTFSPPKPDDDN